MVKTWRQKLAAKRDRFLATLTRDSEFFGFIGRGYPNSFYKLYVRPKPTSWRWWWFESLAQPSGIDPIKRHKRVPPWGRVETVHGPLKDLVKYKFMPERPEMGRLFERAAELNREAELNQKRDPESKAA